MQVEANTDVASIHVIWMMKSATWLEVRYSWQVYVGLVAGRSVAAVSRD